MIEGMLDRAGFHYEVIDAEENPDLSRKYDIMQAPTLVMVHGNAADSYVNASNILKYVNRDGAAA